MKKTNKAAHARALGIARSTLYYKPKLPDKDWKLKCDIEKVLRIHPAYGHRRLAIELKVNKKRILRVMKKFGIKPYRRRGKKWKNPNKPQIKIKYPNILMEETPSYPNHIWATDFTYLWFQEKWIYVCTMMDLFTRKIVGFSVLNNHSVQLVINGFFSAINKHPKPSIIHSDNGSEYNSKDFLRILSNLGIRVSRSKPGSPWENGYQESFYNQFKVDLGDHNRFNTLGELVFEIYKTIYTYNNTRIHTALRMAPKAFHLQYQLTQISYTNVSEKMGT